MPTIRVHTTQNVTIEYEVAGLGTRIVAAIIDNLILGAYIGLVIGGFALVTTNFGQAIERTPVIIALALVVGIPYVFYNLACEVWLNGQSLGKKTMSIRVMRLDGTAPRLGDYALRWLMRIVDIHLPGIGPLVAIVAIAAGNKGQRLGDMVAGTTVISLKERVAALPTLATPATVSYQPVFPQAAALTDHDATLLHQLLGRSLQQGNYELLHETANKIKVLLQVSSDLSDEAFLRTVLRDHAHLAYESEPVRYGG